MADPLPQTGMQCKARFERMQVDAFAFQRTPQPFDEDVVHPSAPPVHADPHVRIRQHLSERQAGELTALDALLFVNKQLRAH
jgi:hypothetical protein